MQKAKPLKTLSGLDFAVLGIAFALQDRLAFGSLDPDLRPGGRWVLLGCEKPPRGSCKQNQPKSSAGLPQDLESLHLGQKT